MPFLGSVSKLGGLFGEGGALSVDPNRGGTLAADERWAEPEGAWDTAKSWLLGRKKEKLPPLIGAKPAQPVQAVGGMAGAFKQPAAPIDYWGRPQTGQQQPQKPNTGYYPDDDYDDDDYDDDDYDY